MKATILFTIPNFITAGSGQVLLNIVKRLDPNKFSPTICVMKKGGKLDKEIEKLEIPFFEAPFSIKAKPRRSLLVRAYKAAKVFKPYKFDIWHSFHYLDDYTEPIIAKLSGVKNWIYTKKSMSWGTRAWKARSYLATRIVVDNSEMEEAFFNKQSLRKKLSCRNY